MKRLIQVFTAIAITSLISLASPVQAVPITVNYVDAENVGFNDPVLGQMRRSAFEITMFACASSIQGNVPITVETYFLYGAGADWGYSEGWPNTFVRDFDGVPGGIYYPISLANQKIGEDFNPGIADMTLVFNGDMDISGGNYGEKWYYGWDGIAGNNVDFISEVAHGFLRGIGFYTLLDPNTGEYDILVGDTIGYPDIFTTNLAFVWGGYNINMTQIPANLRKLVLSSTDTLKWTGPALTQAAGYFAPMYCPAVPAGENAPYGVGDHFDPGYGLYQIMWPWYVGPCHDLSSARYVLQDIGWTLF